LLLFLRLRQQAVVVLFKGPTIWIFQFLLCSLAKWYLIGQEQVPLTVQPGKGTWELGAQRSDMGGRNAALILCSVASLEAQLHMPMSVIF
jgi:hypothetical protein